jgi:class 3 adenylate cyclase
VSPAARHLSALVPAFLDARLVRAPNAVHGWHDELTAALLFADLTGFTPLTDRLARQGSTGTEQLSHILNVCFGRLVDEILAYGGDVLRFAGDAPIAVFEAEDASSEALGRAMVRAAAAGLALQVAMPAIALASGEALSLRVGISAGRMTAMSVGGAADRFEVVVGGDAFPRVAAALAAADPGDVVLAAAPGIPVAPEIISSNLGAELFRVIDVHGERDAPRVAIEALRPTAPAEAYRPYISRGVIARVDAGHTDWVAELRRASVLFVTLQDVDYESAAAPQLVQHLFAVIQDAVYRAGGSVNQFVLDDKGTTCVAAWGVPAHVHDNDPARAAATALEIEAGLGALGARFGIGVATGRVFCGWRGNERRREYALIGSTVNLAARLAMSRSGGVRCDAATREAAGHRLAFRAEGAVHLKGKSQAVDVFVPTGPVPRPARDVAGSSMVGRIAERALLADALDRLTRGQGRTILVSGEAGAGKSTLLADLQLRAGAAGVRCVAAAGAPIGRAVALDVWASLIEQLFEIPAHASADERAATVARRLDDEPYLRDRAPLIASILGAELPPTDVTIHLGGQLRAEATGDALVRLFDREAAQSPLLVIVDDTQWVDSPSWRALSALVRLAPPLLLVAGLRVTGEPPQEWQDVRSAPDVAHVDLGRLTDAESVELARRELGGAAIPDAVAALVREKTAGHPLFVGELVRWLRDTGALVVANGTCRLTRDLDDLPQDLPGSVEGVILGRLDRLDPAPQLTLRVASVIGPTFSVDALVGIHPLQSAASAVAADLADASRLGFVHGAPGSASVFVFRHALMQDAAYGLMVPSQRTALHGALAGWLERTVAVPDRPAAVLAHHWTRGEQPARAIDYLERAGQMAFAQGAARESLRFLRRSLDLTERHALPIDHHRIAQWLHGTAKAQLQLGAAAKAREDLGAGLALLGFTLPVSRRGLRARLAREVLRQTRHLLLPGLVRRRRVDRDRAVTTLKLLRSVGDAAYFQADHLTYFTTSLASVNHAEESGVVGDATMGFTSSAYVASLLKMERLAQRWWRVVGEPRDVDQRLPMMVAKSMSLLQQARWSEVEPILDGAIEEARHVGAHQFLTSALIAQLLVRYYSRGVDAALESAHALLESALARRNELHELWAQQALVAFLIDKGQLEIALEHEARVVELASTVTDELTRATVLGHRILVALATDELSSVADDVPELARLVRTSPPASVGTLGPFLSLTKYYLAAWSRAQARGEPVGVLPAQTRWACTQLGRFAFFFRFARPMHLIVVGEIHRLRGKRGRARRSWRRAMELAEQLHMPAVEAEAAGDLARDATPGSPEARVFRERSAARYREAGFVRLSAS